MAAPRDWSDFNWFITEYVPRQTIPILKKFAAHIEIRSRLSVNLRAGDKKADIVEKVTVAFRVLKTRNALDEYLAIRQNCEQEGIAMAYRPTSYGAPSIPNPTFGGVPARTANGHSGANTAYGYGGYSGASAIAQRGQPAAGPSRTNGWQTQSNTTTAYSSRAPHLQDWKPNPMWKPIRALTNMEMLPDIGPSESSHTRRERKLHVTLTPDIIDKLNHSKSHPQAHPQHSVRIFCASSDYYRAPNAPLTPANGLINNKAIPIEYPTNPDVYVDEYGLPFKERGLRGKAGSAPPFDLDKGTKGLPKVAGRMTSVSMGHTGPTVGKKKDVSKKFYFQVVYCEITSPTELQNRIDRMIPAGAQESLKLLRKKQDDDDDIVFGSSKMSLKDPLTLMRLTRPVRSTRCAHLQCFEAKWWISGNEKHPQWLCPLCNHELRFDELIVDGYTLEILAKVPEEYDEVLIEADNAWHTKDGKYGSQSWMAEYANANGNGVTNGDTTAEDNKAPTPPPEQEDRKPSEFRLSSSPDPKGKRKAIEILSSDDEEEQPLSKASSRPPPPTRADSRLSVAVSASRPPSTRPQSAAPPAVIDLTLSDSDDSEAEDPYFDRPNDRRTQGAGSVSVPPVKPLEDRSSVRSPYAPAFIPANDPRTRGGDSYRPGPSRSDAASRPYPNPTSHPAGGLSDPSLYASNTVHYHNSQDRLAPPRRADTWRPSDRDRDREREERYERYGQGRSSGKYFNGNNHDDDDDDEWSPYNRARRDNVPLATSSDVSRSPRKQARGRRYSPVKSNEIAPMAAQSIQSTEGGASLGDLFGEEQASAIDRPPVNDLFPNERVELNNRLPSGTTTSAAGDHGQVRAGTSGTDTLTDLFEEDPAMMEIFNNASGPRSDGPDEGPSLTDLFAEDDSLALDSANRLVSTLQDLFGDEDNHKTAGPSAPTGETREQATPVTPIRAERGAMPPIPRSADEEIAVDTLL